MNVSQTNKSCFAGDTKQSRIYFFTAVAIAVTEKAFTNSTVFG